MSGTKRNNRNSKPYAWSIHDLCVINDCVIYPVEVNLIIRDSNNMENATIRDKCTQIV